MDLVARLGAWALPAVRRVPPRRAGNFLLLAQKKVTKEKSLSILPNFLAAKSSPLAATE